MTQSLFIFAIAFTFSSFTQAANTLWNNLRVDGLTIQPTTPVSSPTFAWLPDGTNQSQTRKECFYQNFTAKLPTSPTAQQQAKEWQTLIDNCAEDWGRYADPNIRSLVSMQNMNFHPESNPNIKTVRIRTTSGSIRNGYLALQSKQKPRPLIIYLCGLYCGLDSVMLRNSLMYFFEDTNYHVLALTSSLGEEDIAANKKVNVGGFIDGKDIADIALSLRQSSLAQNISSIHVIGQSLGGHGALYSSFWASQQAKPAIQSTLALCPVVALEPSMRYIFNDSFWGGMIYIPESRTALAKAAESVPYVQQLLQKRGEVPDNKLFDLMSEISWAGEKRWFQLATNTFRFDIEDNRDTFFFFNDFAHFIRATTIPTMIVSATNDVFLSTELNRQALELTYIAPPSLGYVSLPAGSHCGFHQALGWRNFAELIKSHIQHWTNSPTTTTIPEINIAKWVKDQSWPRSLSLFPQDQYLEMQFSASAGESEFHVKVLIQEGLKCTNGPLEGPSKKCIKEVGVNIPFSLIPVPLEVPQDKYAANRLTRWANAHIKVLTADRQPIYGSRSQPTWLTVVNDD